MLWFSSFAMSSIRLFAGSIFGIIDRDHNRCQRQAEQVAPREELLQESTDPHRTAFKDSGTKNEVLVRNDSPLRRKGIFHVGKSVAPEKAGLWPGRRLALHEAAISAPERILATSESRTQCPRHAESPAIGEDYVPARAQHPLNILKGVSVGTEITNNPQQNNDIKLSVQCFRIDVQHVKRKLPISFILLPAMFNHRRRVVDTYTTPGRIFRNDFLKIAPAATAYFGDRCRLIVKLPADEIARKLLPLLDLQLDDVLDFPGMDPAPNRRTLAVKSLNHLFFSLLHHHKTDFTTW